MTYAIFFVKGDSIMLHILLLLTLVLLLLFVFSALFMAICSACILLLRKKSDEEMEYEDAMQTQWLMEYQTKHQK